MSHQSYIREVEGSDTAVLMIHGILGTPNHFHFLHPYIPANWSVYNILLDGHGGSVEDFAHTSMAKWEAQVERMAEELCRRYQQVLIAAHSMGTLFAIDAALRHPEVKQLFLLAPPLEVAPRSEAFFNALKVGLGHVAEDDAPAVATRQAYSLQPEKRVWKYSGWIPRYLELFRKIRRIKCKLSELSTPAVAFLSRHDELVSFHTMEVLEGIVCIQREVLENSGHYAYDPVDAAQIVTAFIDVCGKLEQEKGRDII